MPRTSFTLNGTRYELSSDIVTCHLAGVGPEPIREHAVQVGGVWYPVKQAFEIAVGVPRPEFTSRTARRHLAKLGFPISGEAHSPESSVAPGPTADIQHPKAQRHPRDEQWHTEANVQAAVVSALVASGYRIQSVANTATREHGIDIVATLDGMAIGIEVKGFPSKTYANPALVDRPKRTQPSNQAGHWFAAAVLAAMKLRGKQPDWRSIIALPDFKRYRNLYSETHTSLAAAGITVWWVDAEGTVEFD
ncbi:hypothetical protein ACQCX5_02485 [Propionibacteriaceae bacterium G57]|uniref:hypothetical protein n=1 Tax=Aestuariimicrobium sp. G57 TaxID=3418485 RepID=UPI003DA78A52